MYYSELKELSELSREPSVTISLSTDRHNQRSQKANIVLKNLIKDAEDRLAELYDKRVVWAIVENLRTLESEINHENNSDSLILFASEAYKRAVKLPIPIEKDTVQIDDKFATRHLLRGIKQTEHYYVLTLSKDEIRILEFYNDQFVKEINNPDLTFVNETSYVSHFHRMAIGSLRNTYLREFFQRGDQVFHRIYNDTPLPIILAGVVRNIDFYREVAHPDEWIIGSIRGNFNSKHTTTAELAKLAYPVIQAYIADEISHSLSALEKAENENKLANELSHIYRAASEGRGQKLYVEKDFFQTVTVEDHFLALKEEVTGAEIIDDMVNDIIHMVMQFGGEVVFVPNGYLQKYHHIALIVRYG